MWRVEFGAKTRLEAGNSSEKGKRKNLPSKIAKKIFVEEEKKVLMIVKVGLIK